MSLNTVTKRVDDVLSWVKRQFGDESGVQITDADIIRWLNQAQFEIGSSADAIQAIASTDYVAGQHTYDAPLSNAIKIIAVNVNGIPIPGIEFSYAQEYIMTNDPFRTQQGNPAYWWRFANKLYFWPTPDTSYPGGMEIYYIAAPADVSTASDFLSLPDKYFEAIIQYVMGKAYELDEDDQGMQRARQMFSDSLGQTFEEDRSETLHYPSLTFLED